MGRVKSYESIVKGENVPVPDIPESFKVLVKEIRSLALDIEPMHDADEDGSATVTAEETSALDDLAALAGVDTDVEAEDAETAEAPRLSPPRPIDKEELTVADFEATDFDSVEFRLLPPTRSVPGRTVR